MGLLETLGKKAPGEGWYLPAPAELPLGANHPGEAASSARLDVQPHPRRVENPGRAQGRCSSATVRSWCVVSSARNREQQPQYRQGDVSGLDPEDAEHRGRSWWARRGIIMRKMIKDSGQATHNAKQFKLGHLGTLNQVIVALGKTIRAMADGSVDFSGGLSDRQWLGDHAAVLGDQDAGSARGAVRSDREHRGGIWHDKQSHGSRLALRTWRSGAFLAAAQST